MENTTINNTGKADRKTVSFYEQDYKKYCDLKGMYEDGRGVNHHDVMNYLLSLENSRFDKGTMKVERKLKQWLILGYSGEITVKGLRYAEYEGTAKQISFNAVKAVVEMYSEEIEAHNKKLTEEQK